MSINNQLWIILFPLAIGLWVALGTATGLYFLRRHLRSTEKRIVLVISIGSIWIAYSIIFQDIVRKLLGQYAMMSLTFVGAGIILGGVVMWLKSDGGLRS
jgi:hypothetical protein